MIRAAKGEDVTKQLQQIESELMAEVEVRNFDKEDSENFSVNYERKREELYCSMEMNGINNPGSLTSFQFYSRLAVLKKKVTTNH